MRGAKVLDGVVSSLGSGDDMIGRRAERITGPSRRADHSPTQPTRPPVLIQHPGQELAGLAPAPLRAAHEMTTAARIRTHETTKELAHRRIDLGLIRLFGDARTDRQEGGGDSGDKDGEDEEESSHDAGLVCAVAVRVEGLPLVIVKRGRAARLRPCARATSRSCAVAMSFHHTRGIVDSAGIENATAKDLHTGRRGSAVTAAPPWSRGPREWR